LRVANENTPMKVKEKLLLFLLCFSLLHGASSPLMFEGNKEISQRELYDMLHVAQPYFYEFWKKEPSVNPQRGTLIAQAVKNYYRSRGFFHANVTVAQKEQTLQITIEENLPTRVVDIAINSQLDIKPYIPFTLGMIFDAQKFDQSKKDIKLFYGDYGYCDAEIQTKAWIDIKTNSAYLTYETTQNGLCYFDKIAILPSQNIDTDIIESFLSIEEGSLFSTKSIRQSYENLYGNEGIAKALIDTEVIEKGKAHAKVSVTENEKPIRFQIGLGVSSDEGFMALLGVKHRNLFGNLKTLALNTRVTQIKQTIETNFDMPLVNHQATGVKVGYENELFLGFKEERVFGSLYLKQKGVEHQFQESLVFDNSLTYDSQDEALYVPGSLFLASPKLEWSYDTRDNFLNPTQGHFIRSSVMGSLESELSDATYYKYNLSGGFIIPFLPSTLAFKADFGSLHLFSGDLPPSYLFYAGGMNSNRAYGYRKLGKINDKEDPIGFDSLLETTVEYRFGIWEKLRGVVFQDTTFIAETAIPDTSKGYYSAGFGLRYVTPIGPLGVDFGFDINDPSRRYAFHFHIGELF